jgi:hypothetical protein
MLNRLKIIPKHEEKLQPYSLVVESEGSTLPILNPISGHDSEVQFVSHATYNILSILSFLSLKEKLPFPN